MGVNLRCYSLLFSDTHRKHQHKASRVSDVVVTVQPLDHPSGMITVATEAEMKAIYRLIV